MNCKNVSEKGEVFFYVCSVHIAKHNKMSGIMQVVGCGNSPLEGWPRPRRGRSGKYVQIILDSSLTTLALK